MSEQKGKRAPRESARRTTAWSEPKPAETTPAEAAPAETAPVETAPVETAAETAWEMAAPAPEIAAPEMPPAVPAPLRRGEAAAGEFRPLGHDALVAFAESQAALARGFGAFVLELTGLARSGAAVAAESATAMLGAKTLAEAIGVNFGFAQRSFDRAIEGSAKLSEIGVRLAADTARPILLRLSDAWKTPMAG